jgi:thiaminase
VRGGATAPWTRGASAAGWSRTTYSCWTTCACSRWPPAEPRYWQWVETYADPGFAELAAWCVGLLDRVAACERAFRTNLDHELAFWDA